MKKLVGLALVLLLSVFVVLRALWVEIRFLPRAQSQTQALDTAKSGIAQASKESQAKEIKALEAPSDMAIPPEVMQQINSQTQAAPATAAPSVPEQVPAQPVPAPAPTVPAMTIPAMNAGSGELPPMEGEMAPPTSPQQIDPQLKFTNSEGFIYDPIGRRDPFKTYIQKEVPRVATPLADLPLAKPTLENEGRSMRTFTLPGSGSSPLENADVSVLKLVGILWDVKDPKAMVRANNNKVYLVKRLSKIGSNNGYVATIREGELIVVEISQDGKTPTTRIMTLQK